MNPRNGSPLGDQRHRHHASWNLWSPTKTKGNVLWNHPGMKKNMNSLKGMWYSNPYTNCHLLLLGGKKSVSFVMSPFMRKSWLEWMGSPPTKPWSWKSSNPLGRNWTKLWCSNGFFPMRMGQKKTSLKIEITIKQVQEDMCYHMFLFLLGYGIHMDTSRIHYNPNSMDLSMQAYMFFGIILPIF